MQGDVSHVDVDDDNDDVHAAFESATEGMPACQAKHRMCIETLHEREHMQ